MKLTFGAELSVKFIYLKCTKHKVFCISLLCLSIYSVLNLMFCQKSVLNVFLWFAPVFILKNYFHFIKYLAEATGLNDWLIFGGVGGA